MAVYQISYDLQKQIITLRVTTELNPAEPNANSMTLHGSLSLTKLLRKFAGLFWLW
ncbi:hypothetical protein [Pectobacterium brasiliense]|uniref:hypothetical protein n=1 Tax=Pectobacterium brasiliense TaxID=180957 RepID=UPI0032ECC081